MTRIRRRLAVGHGALLGLEIPILEDGLFDLLATMCLRTNLVG